MNQEQKQILQGLSTSILVIEDHMRTMDDFTNLRENYYNAMKGGFEIDEIRHCPIRFYFHEGDEQMHILQLNHFIPNLFMWEPFARLETYDDLDETCIVDCTRITNDLIKEFLDEKLIFPYRQEFTNYKMNKVSHDVIYNLGRISSDFNELLGLTMNAESFMKIADRNERFDEIIRTKFDDAMQPQDVEHQSNELTDEIIEIFKAEEGCLQPILRSDTGIKSGQLKEFTINAGLTTAPYSDIRKAS